MSDCFDHEADAWDSLDWDFDEDYHFSHRSGYGYDHFIKNSLYYHKHVSFVGIERQTEKAYLVDFGSASLWIPKKIVKELDIKEHSMYIHKRTFNEIVSTYKERRNE